MLSVLVISIFANLNLRASRVPAQRVGQRLNSRQPVSWPFNRLAEKEVKMRVKMGTVVPKMGTFVHLIEELTDYRAAMAVALHEELGETHRAIKMAMRWTGASERTVKYWFAGERGPSGEHLVSLVRHSDAVLFMLLALADRLAPEEAMK
jgi:hypothetical protein